MTRTAGSGPVAEVVVPGALRGTNRSVSCFPSLIERGMGDSSNTEKAAGPGAPGPGAPFEGAAVVLGVIVGAAGISGPLGAVEEAVTGEVETVEAAGGAAPVRGPAGASFRESDWRPLARRNDVASLDGGWSPPSSSGDGLSD